MPYLAVLAAHNQHKSISTPPPPDSSQPTDLEVKHTPRSESPVRGHPVLSALQPLLSASAGTILGNPLDLAAYRQCMGRDVIPRPIPTACLDKANHYREALYAGGLGRFLLLSGSFGAVKAAGELTDNKAAIIAAENFATWPLWIANKLVSDGVKWKDLPKNLLPYITPKSCASYSAANIGSTIGPLAVVPHVEIKFQEEGMPSTPARLAATLLTSGVSALALQLRNPIMGGTIRGGFPFAFLREFVSGILMTSLLPTESPDNPAQNK